MRIYDRGNYRDATQEELEQMEKEKRQYEVYEKFRPLTNEEAMEVVIKAQINTLDIDDNTALIMINYYPDWSDLINQKAEKDFKFVYEGKLYKVLQEHTFSSEWVPNNGTESLYSRIDEEHDGDLYDPIPYEPNMVLEKDKYYIQNDVIYKCINGSGIAVYAEQISSFIKLYVEVVDISLL